MFDASLIQVSRGLKRSWQTLQFCWSLDNMSLVTLVKIITFWSLMNFLQTHSFAESVAKTSTNSETPVLVQAVMV